MPASPWRTLSSPVLDREYVALLSYLPLKSRWRLPAFIVYTAQVMNQLASTKGLIGYTLLAHPLSKKAWTLSAWESNDALETFVNDPPHVRIMAALAPHLDKTSFVRWAVKGSQLPLTWPDALGRLVSEEGTAGR
jgi:quinol monooxygenase YgiN